VKMEAKKRGGNYWEKKEEKKEEKKKGKTKEKKEEEKQARLRGSSAPLHTKKFMDGGVFFCSRII